MCNHISSCNSKYTKLIIMYIYIYIFKIHAVIVYKIGLPCTNKKRSERKRIFWWHSQQYGNENEYRYTSNTYCCELKIVYVYKSYSYSLLSLPTSLNINTKCYNKEKQNRFSCYDTWFNRRIDLQLLNYKLVNYTSTLKLYLVVHMLYKIIQNWIVAKNKSLPSWIIKYI